ncbi:hypothetical protein ACFRFU_50255 [Streptomyces sp. NPDC056704]
MPFVALEHPGGWALMPLVLITVVVALVAIGLIARVMALIAQR